MTQKEFIISAETGKKTQNQKRKTLRLLCWASFHHLIRMKRKRAMSSGFHRHKFTLYPQSASRKVFARLFSLGWRCHLCLPQSSLLYRNPADFATICEIVNWQTSYARETQIKQPENSLSESSLALGNLLKILEPVAFFVYRLMRYH